MKKIFLLLGIGLVVLIIVVAVAVGMNLGPIIKIGMEQIGPKVTQVSIKVDTVGVSLLTGSAAVKGLIVGNPQGYSTPQAINVGNIAVTLDPLSVTSNKIVVRSIHVESPEITFEGGLSSNNLTKIADNVNAVSKNNSPASANTAAETPGKPAPKIEVDDFLVTGAKVHFYLTGLGNKEISLPDIHLTNLGKDTNGLTPAQLTNAVMGAISSDTVSAVASTVTELGQGVKSLGNSAAKTVGADVGKITSGLGGLFGK
jgi:hypothetical protein